MTALNVSQGTIQWLVTGYMLVIGICMPLSSLYQNGLTLKRILLLHLAPLFWARLCLRWALFSGCAYWAIDSRHWHGADFAADVFSRHADFPAI